jgi:hypothetical protein
MSIACYVIAGFFFLVGIGSHPRDAGSYLAASGIWVLVGNSF